MPYHSHMASLALGTLATLTSLARAYQDDQVWDVLAVLNTFDRSNAVPFCSNYIHYQEPVETCWVTHAPVTVTTTTPCGPMTPAPEQTEYATGYHPSVITILTTTTITYTTTSTIYIPATSYPTAHKHKRDIYCPDYDLPCRIVQYDAPAIHTACAKYLDQGAVTETLTKHVAAATATVTAADCGAYGYDAKPGGGYAAGSGNHGDGEGYGDGDGYGYEQEDGYEDGYGHEQEYGYDDGAHVGDGEDRGAGMYDYSAGDGEDVPPGVYDHTVGEGEDVPAYLEGAVGDGEDLPDEFYMDGTNEEEQDDGLGYSPYDR